MIRLVAFEHHDAVTRAGRALFDEVSWDVPILDAGAAPTLRPGVVEVVVAPGSEALGEEVHPSMPVARLRDLADARSILWQAHWGSGKLIEELFEATVEDGLVGPVFVTGHPVEISPLARVDRHDPALTERFELYVGGRELANGYSELNDPIEQRHRFEDEQKAKEAGDLGAQ